MRFSSMKLLFRNESNQCEANEECLLILGSQKLLSYLSYEDIHHKFGSTVTKQNYEEVCKLLQTSNYDALSLHLRSATIARLPSTCSRNNTPSQAHSITKLVKIHGSNRDGCIIIVCHYQHVFASACAVARAYPLYSKKQDKELKSMVVEFIVINEKGERQILSDSEIKCLNVAGESVRLASRIADTPCGEMHTDAFIKEITVIGEQLGIKPTIIQGKELEERGFGGIYNVGKAAEHPPALAVLSHTPPGATMNIAWVGKGIVYDTGGLNIKQRSSMCGMKRDCAGAAAVLGAFYLAVKTGFEQNLHAVFCLAENAVGPLAVRPDDVITLYSSKTVEINNTDAEGRLVLADGVFYAKKDLNATIIVDIATLTGAQGSATGKMHGAVLTNSAQWENMSIAAGKVSGDLVFPVVYAPELHFSEFHSQIADMKNSVADYSNAAVSCGGLFIHNQIGFDFNGSFLHFDISKASTSGERTNGFGVALVNVLFGHMSGCSLLQNISPKLNPTDNSNGSELK